ncbi:unnamed protein product [Calypogeia fissa]
MSRYECYRRSGFQRANMRRLLASVAGCPISIPMTIVMSGISKMFVGELVEIGRIVMTERNDVGPIRPCHIREAYRRLKLEAEPSRPEEGVFGCGAHSDYGLLTFLARDSNPGLQVCHCWSILASDLLTLHMLFLYIWWTKSSLARSNELQIDLYLLYRSKPRQ